MSIMTFLLLITSPSRRHLLGLDERHISLLSFWKKTKNKNLDSDNIVLSLGQTAATGAEKANRAPAHMYCMNNLVWDNFV